MNQKSSVTPVETEEELDNYIQQSQDLLIVIDVHPAWSGPCATLDPTFSRVLLTTDKCEERLAFISCDERFAEKIQTLSTDEAKFTLSERGCNPLFLAVRFGKAVAKVDGANSPALASMIETQIPPVPGEDED